jgi:hypothetical protein
MRKTDIFPFFMYLQVIDIYMNLHIILHISCIHISFEGARKEETDIWYVTIWEVKHKVGSLYSWKTKVISSELNQR